MFVKIQCLSFSFSVVTQTCVQDTCMPLSLEVQFCGSQKTLKLTSLFLCCCIALSP